MVMSALLDARYEICRRSFSLPFQSPHVPRGASRQPFQPPHAALGFQPADATRFFSALQEAFSRLNSSLFLSSFFSS